jgi:PleD family two-component response regulator
MPNFSRHEAAATAERIRAAIDEANPGGMLKVAVSIGVTDSESEFATDATALFKIADAAMYMAKGQKNRVVVDSGIDPTKGRMLEAT